MPRPASPTSENDTLSLHDALPISHQRFAAHGSCIRSARFSATRRPWLSDPPGRPGHFASPPRSSGSRPRAGCARCPEKPVASARWRSEEHTSELQPQSKLVCRVLLRLLPRTTLFPYTTLFRSLTSGLQLTVAVFVRLGFQQPGGHGSATRRDGQDTLQVPLDRPEVGLGQDVHVALKSQSPVLGGDRKSTRLNSSHSQSSYAASCFAYFRERHSFPTRRSSDLSPAVCSSR